MNVNIQRDGITLRGVVNKPQNVAACPVLIIFHGFAGDIGYESTNLYWKIADELENIGIASVRFDFYGHGKSDGQFQKMNILEELLDAIAILEFVQTLPFVTDIYLLGHSQGGVIASMLAGMYADIIKKLVLLAPAASLKDDAQKGTCMGTTYDTNHIPDRLVIDDRHLMGGHYFRIAKFLPIYETVVNFEKAALLIHGYNDDCVPYSVSEHFHELLRDSKMYLFDRLDHAIEGPDQMKVFQLIKDFLA